MFRPSLAWPLAISSLPASLLLLSAAIGLVVLFGLAALTLVPLLIFLGGVVVWITATVLMAWGGIEALAACERWMERAPRFQR